MSRHLIACEECRETVRSMQLAAGLFREAAPVPTAPSTDLWDRLEGRLRVLQAESPPVRRAPMGYYGGLLAATAALFLYVHLPQGATTTPDTDAALVNGTSASVDASRSASLQHPDGATSTGSRSPIKISARPTNLSGNDPALAGTLSSPALRHHALPVQLPGNRGHQMGRAANRWERRNRGALSRSAFGNALVSQTGTMRHLTEPHRTLLSRRMLIALAPRRRVEHSTFVAGAEATGVAGRAPVSSPTTRGGSHSAPAGHIRLAEDAARVYALTATEDTPFAVAAGDEVAVRTVVARVMQVGERFRGDSLSGGGDGVGNTSGSGSGSFMEVSAAKPDGGTVKPFFSQVQTLNPGGQPRLTSRMWGNVSPSGTVESIHSEWISP